jgi:hypothetical protein
MKLEKIKFSTLFIFDEIGPTILVRAKINKTSWYQDPINVFLKKSNMPSRLQAHRGKPRSRNYKKYNSALCSFLMRLAQQYWSGQKLMRPPGIRIQEIYF